MILGWKGGCQWGGLGMVEAMGFIHHPNTCLIPLAPSREKTLTLFPDLIDLPAAHSKRWIDGWMDEGRDDCCGSGLHEDRIKDGRKDRK